MIAAAAAAWNKAALVTLLWDLFGLGPNISIFGPSHFSCGESLKPARTANHPTLRPPVQRGLMNSVHAWGILMRSLFSRLEKT